MGIGSSSLWVAQGVYVTNAAAAYSIERQKSSKSAMGSFTGIFFGIFQGNQVVGNLMSSLLLSDKHLKDTQKVLFYSCVGIGVVSTFFFMLLRDNRVSPRPLIPANASIQQQQQQESSPKKSKDVAVSSFMGCLNLLRDPQMLLLLPTFFYSGAQGAVMRHVYTVYTHLFFPSHIEHSHT